MGIVFLTRWNHQCVFLKVMTQYMIHRAGDIAKRNTHERGSRSVVQVNKAKQRNHYCGKKSKRDDERQDVSRNGFQIPTHFVTSILNKTLHIIP